jgi:ParB family chromosome partitioning protein
MAEKRLGTGLGALFGDAALESESNDFDFLPISKVEPRQNQPRNLFSPEGLEELADSIREHGIIQPLTVRRLEGGYFQIIAVITPVESGQNCRPDPGAGADYRG